MAKLKWGKMTVEIAPVVSTGDQVWKTVFTPVQDSFALNVEEGEKLEAFIEGGERIAVKKDKNKFSFEFEVFIADELSKPIADDDGLIEGEYSIRVTPENPTLDGFIMKRAAVSVTETFTSKDGHKAKYVFEALKPSSGKMLESYITPSE
jgi:hypothetical protein